MRGRTIWGGILLALAVIIAVVLISHGGAYSRFEPPQRDGPMGLVQAASGPSLWLATTQEEERSIRMGGGRFSSGRWITRSHYHLRVQAHDPLTAQRRWLATLKVVDGEVGGRAAQVRIIGQHGAVVWVWGHDEMLALSADDGRVLADMAMLTSTNPEIGALLPRELAHYTWVGELVATLADGRVMRIAADDWRAAPYRIEDDESFRRASYMTTTWNGGYETKQFGVRHGVFDGDWIGLLSEKEVADAVDDGFGDHYADAAEIDDEGATARRTVLRAGVGRTREFSEGSHPRIERLDAIDGAGTYLQGLLLRKASAPGAPAFTLRGRHWRPTPGEPLRLADPDGVLVLHRDRMDAQGRLQLTRLDARFAERWHTALPFAELSNRWELGSHLLLIGSWNDGAPGMSDWHEAVLALDLATGAWRGWDIRHEAPMSP